MPQPSQTDAAQSFYERATVAQAAGQYAEGVRLLWQGVQHGEMNAMTQLGGQLISGRGAPPDPAKGAQLMLEAANRGGAYACAMASTIVASGLFGPRDWERALDYLQRSAELGYETAQDQLKLLARRRGVVKADPSVWSLLRQRVDLNGWRACPADRLLTDDGAIRVVDKFAAADVCDWIIARAQGRFAPATVFGPSGEGAVKEGDRTNSFAGFDLLNIDLVVLLILDRLAAACGGSPGAMEPPHVLHYAVGQQFASHYDFLDPEVAGHVGDLARHGQRTQTLLIYLNEGFEGGETDFPLLDVRFKGGKGDLLIFANADRDGAPDRRMLHAGLPPTAGEKWVLSQWVRNRLPAARG